MQWSKLKSRFKSLVCPELRDRLDFHVTSYRESHDGAGEIWITLDGTKIFDCGHYTFEFAESDGYHHGKAGEELTQWLKSKEIYSPRFVGGSMREYLDTPVNEAISSSNPFLKAFAIIDRRTGRRTIERLNLSESEHSLVKKFYELRQG